MTFTLWPHQLRTLEMISAARRSGTKRLCIQGPTGSGKSAAMLTLAKQEVSEGGRVVIYTNRRTILAQLSEVFENHDLYHGVRAAGHKPKLLERVQVSSIMTERARALGADAKWELHDATLVIVDEAHLQKARTARTILRHHWKRGAFLTGWTATPVGIGHIYEQVISMASLAELRESGVLVWCDTYAPYEIDMTGIRMVGDEFHIGQTRQRVRECICIGSVVDHYRQLNPQHYPTVCFAPGVAESRWMADQFNWHGHPAAHVDAKTSEKRRHEIFKHWRSGEIQIVCNYGILREGFDFQRCRHAILIQPTAKISTYLQIVGRILRGAPGKANAILQDHTGAYWRHGSPNEDRHWSLDDTDSRLAKDRKKKDGANDARVCPICGAVRYAIPGFYGRCPMCGYERAPVVRVVRETSGKLKLVNDRPRKKVEDTVTLWRQCIYTAARAGMTAGQAVAMCKTKSGRWIGVSESPWPVPHPASPDWNTPATLYWPWAAKKGSYETGRDGT